MIARVLHVVPDLVPYGLERMVATLATLADRCRFEVSIASLYAEKPGGIAAELEAEGVRVFHLDKRKGLDPRMFGRIARLLAELRPDILHTHNYVLRYTLPAMWKSRPRACVHTIHNVADREVDRAGIWLQRLAFRRLVQPVAIAEAAAASFERVYRQPRPPLIMNGIDVARFQRSSGNARLDWRDREGFAQDDILFVCVGRLFVQKNHRDLLSAFAAGPARLPRVKLLLAGDGQLGPALERQARDLNIAKQVRFLGRREDIPELLAAADVFVLASLWEGNPLAVMEAMAAGLPSVVTEVGGVPELVHSGTHGIVVPPGDVPLLAQAMALLAGDASLRLRMGAASARHARENFDSKRMVEAYEALYERLLPAAVQGGANACVSG